MANLTKQQQLIASVRDALSDAYGFVRGAQYTRQVAQTTTEQLIDAAIAKIRGTTGVVTSRPCKLDRITEVETSLIAVVEKVKNTPVEDWVWGTGQDVSSADRANTSEKG